MRRARGGPYLCKCVNQEDSLGHIDARQLDGAMIQEEALFQSVPLTRLDAKYSIGPTGQEQLVAIYLLVRDKS